MFFVPALPPPPHTFLPDFERIKKLVQNKSGGSGPPHSPRGYAPGVCFTVGKCGRMDTTFCPAYFI